MAEAPPVDLSTYEFDPCCPLPTGRAARDHVIKKGPCQPTDVDYPKDRFNRKFLSSWYRNFEWLEYSKTSDKAFCFYCRVFNGQVYNTLSYYTHVWRYLQLKQVIVNSVRCRQPSTIKR